MNREPCFLVSLAALERNARTLRAVADAADCRVVLALKGFACWKAFPALTPHLDGCCASGLWEARLARDHFGKQLLTYSPAYSEPEVAELCGFTHHLDFNSLTQWQRFRAQVTAHPRFRAGQLRCGLRINPQLSTGTTPLYDPCAPGSRLGVTADELAGHDLTGISGLHFHTLCEQDSDDLERTLEAVDAGFGRLLRSPQISWLNLGGGHWITKPGYDRHRLVRLVRETRARYQVEAWLEPGEAAAIHTGVLRATVLDAFQSAGHHHAILDASATAHMPDVLEMPYRPEVYLVEPGPGPTGETVSPAAGAPHAPVAATPTTPHQPDLPPVPPPPHPAVQLPGERYHPALNPASLPAIHPPHSVTRLAGPTCLAGDVIGDYAFHRPLVPGDILVFDDMAHYTMVKTTTFNGVRHPAITLQHPDGSLETIRRFHYRDFRDRLA